jgi:hypothetical protein
MGSRASLDIVENRKISLPNQDSNPKSSSLWPCHHKYLLSWQQLTLFPAFVGEGLSVMEDNQMDHLSLVYVTITTLTSLEPDFNK